MVRLPWIALAFAVLGVLVACGDAGDEPEVRYPLIVDPDSVSLGSTLYAQSCAICHGDPKTGDGRQFDAPRHNADGHTWHHPDRQLVQWVLDGPPGGAIMPSFSDRLDETEAAAIIAYIKSTWPEPVQTQHTQLSQAWEDQLAE